MITKKTQQERGFTLIETFIAIMILIVAVVGPLTIAQRALSSSQYAADRITAYYLAQDGIEYIRSVRDGMTLNNTSDNSSSVGATNWLGDDGYTDGIAGCFVSSPNTGNGCKVNYLQNPSITACSVGGCGAMYLDNQGSNPSYIYTYSLTNNGVYTSPTIFTRTIKITPMALTGGTLLSLNPGNGSFNEALVTVTVSWQTNVPGGGSSLGGNSVTLTEDLFNLH